MENLWLMKTEPETYSFDDLVREGRTVWDGVSNPLALKHIRSMQKGDRVLIYHTGSEKAIVGIAEVVGNPGQPAGKNETKLTVVEIKAAARLKSPVTLQAIKANKVFSAFELVRLPRLSVMPVSRPLWDKIVKMGA
ncbi:MAG TPA: EVE domain-containing protein [Bacteroidota bacterium]|nr:EVE domain-containing protein [Bacteroidota bacterium]